MNTKRNEFGQFTKGSKGHLGYKHSEKSKQLMSESRKGLTAKENNPHWNPEIHKGTQIECACGCGTLIPKYDKKGRPAKYIVGHQAMGKPRPEVAEKLKELWAEGKLKSRSGDQHWNWKGGITPLIRLLRHTPEYKAWRLAVYKRDKWTCQDCAKHCDTKTIVAHHIKSFKEYPELRYEVDNGITLCRKCHLKRETATFGAN